MPRRLLLGSHDIEPFTTKMARWPAVRTLVTALATTGLSPEDSRTAMLQGPPREGPRRQRRAG